MDSAKIFKRFEITETTAQEIFSLYDKNLRVDKLELISGGMSTTNYIVCTTGGRGKYLLRIYPAGHDGREIETALHQYLSSHINVPEIDFTGQTDVPEPFSFMIREYIDGTTLCDYISQNKKTDPGMYFNIGGLLAVIHRKRYDSPGRINPCLDIDTRNPSASERIENYLKSYAGSHLGEYIKDRLLGFAAKNPQIFDEIEKSNVLSHGDLNYNNIIVGDDGKIWIIDFEYAFSAPVYYDIGKFFRSKLPDIQRYIGRSEREGFFNGYNMSSSELLPSNWYRYAKLSDIEAMLGLINKKDIPEGWSADIINEITATLRLF